MTEGRICAAHRQRRALVYVRQSSSSQVENNRESTRRQYALAERACALSDGIPTKSQSSMKISACPVPPPKDVADSRA